MHWTRTGLPVQPNGTILRGVAWSWDSFTHATIELPLRWVHPWLREFQSMRNRTRQAAVPRLRSESKRSPEYNGLLSLVVHVAQRATKHGILMHRVRHPKLVFDYAPVPVLVRSHFGDIPARVQETIGASSLRQMLFADVRELLGSDALERQLYPGARCLP